VPVGKRPIRPLVVSDINLFRASSSAAPRYSWNADRAFARFALLGAADEGWCGEAARSPERGKIPLKRIGLLEASEPRSLVSSAAAHIVGE
jgi:hypothetical protein